MSRKDAKLIHGTDGRQANKTASKNPKPVLIGIPAPLYDLLIEIPAKQRKGFLPPKLANVYNDVNTRPTITRKMSPRC